jgi:transposase InsO family protein
MAWRTVEVREQRIRFVVAAHRGDRTLSSLCMEFGISRPTGSLWLKRYRAGGVAAVAEKSRRPLRSPQRTADVVEQRIAQLRAERPDWGARKLAVLLGREGLAMPAATVHRVLIRRGLVRVEDRDRQAPGRFARELPNQLWQMDFKSPKGWNQPVGPLSVIDDASRYVLALDGTWTTRADAVQARLEHAFLRCGLPDARVMDHGTPWWNVTSAGGWTRLTVWLLKQNIRLYFSGIRHPQTQGKVERFHGALEMARRRRGLPEPERHQAWLDDFRQEYNHVRPHEALKMQTPASVWRPSQRSFEANPRPWIYPIGAEVARLQAAGQLMLAGRQWQVAGPLAGEQVRLIRLHQRVLVFYRHTLIRELDIAGQGSTAVDPWPANENNPM